MNKRRIEILAPAGSYEGMKAAMNGGCDAVYIGGSRFGARAFANNLEVLDLKKAIDEAHIREKQIYLTVNTLFKEKEAKEELVPFLEPLYSHGIDAVIVQDVGAMHIIHSHFPDLDIHASTQATLTMAEGANLWKPYGVTRLVTPRELSIKEIKAIRDNTDLEIETFVHGALCYCYSGQCLMSSLIGGRSGNRGRCAQPCRMPYELVTNHSKGGVMEGKFVLSPKDINTVALIPELVDAGIDSFKIEGRMKRPEYAALVAHIYRKYVDFFFEVGAEAYGEFLKHEEFEKDMIRLQDIYNRGGFSNGYGKQYHGKSMMSLNRPNHSGVLVGKVSAVSGSQVTISLSEAINPQDILEIRTTKEEVHEFTVKDAHREGEGITTNVGRIPMDRYKGKDKFGKSGNGKDRNNHGVNIAYRQGRELGSKESYGKENGLVLRMGDLVYRTKNNKMLDQLHETYGKKDQRLGIIGELKAYVGEPLSLKLNRGSNEVTVYHNEVEVAQKQPMTKEKIGISLDKTGDTLYYFEEINMDIQDNIFIPVAWLNEIRRDGITALEKLIVGNYRRDGRIESDYFENKENKENKDNEDNEDNKDNKDNKENKDNIENKDNKDKKVSEYIDEKYQQKIIISVQTKDQLDQGLLNPKVSAIYGNYETLANDIDALINIAKAVDKTKKEFYLVLPHICRQFVYQRLKKDILLLWKEPTIHGFVVKNFEEISLLQSLEKSEGTQKRMILDHNMYVMNQGAKDFYKELGISTFTAPLELNRKELSELQVDQGELLVYGNLPLMVSAQCVFENTSGCTKIKAGVVNQQGKLVDRIGKDFIVQAHCKGCYNVLYNGQCLSLLKYKNEIQKLSPEGIRLDFTFETSTEMAVVLDAFVGSFCYNQQTSLPEGDYTAGHYKRGIE